MDFECPLQTESRVKRKRLINVLIVFSFLCLASIGCSNNGLSVEDTSWYCRRDNSIRICDVKFTVENANYFPVAATVVIRAHQWEGSMFKSSIITTIPEKKVSVVIKPSETREFQETFEGAGRVRKFIVTVYGEKI